MLQVAIAFALATTTLVPTQEQEGANVPRCRVFGRVLDAHGEPVAGAKVDIGTVGEPWRAGATDSNGAALPGSYETETSPEGVFSVDAPLPTSSWVSLRIEPGPYLVLAGRDFGLARDKDPLYEGDNDLGDFTLAAAGAIAVRVVGPDGIELPEARVSLDGDYPGGFVLNGAQGEQGGFLIGHIPAGHYRMEARCDGYQSTLSDQVEVVRSRTTAAPAIALAPAASVAGRVVDQAGEPIAGVRVCGTPLGSGRHAWCETGGDGSFQVQLPNRAPYEFAFTADGFRLIGDRGGLPPVVLQPGSRGAVITMTAASMVSFRVLDAATGAPVEHYGLRVDPVPDESFSSSRTRKPIPPRPVPGGEQTVAATPGQHVVRLEAPGYALATRAVALDSGNETAQTIQLPPAGRLSGVVLHAGGPARRATVRLERTIVKLDPTLPDEPVEERFWSDNYGHDLDEFTGRQRLATTDGEGRFAFDDLAAGTYRLTASGAVGAPLELDALEVGESELVELGRLDLPASAAVVGRVLAPPSVPVAGLEVFLGSPFDEVISRVAADGSFRFDGLQAGEHELVIEAAPGILARNLVQPFTAEAGATREVVLDLRPVQPVRVHLSVELNGHRLPDLIVSHRRGREHGTRPAGRTDSEGELIFELEPAPDLQLTVGSPIGMTLGTIDLEGAVVAGAELEHLVQMEVGDWAVEFPPDFVLPAPGKADLLVTPVPGEPRDRKSITLDTPLLEFRTGIEWTEPRRELGPIAPGTYTVDARVFEFGESPHGFDAFLVYAEPMTATIEVRARGAATAHMALKE